MDKTSNGPEDGLVQYSCRIQAETEPLSIAEKECNDEDHDR